MRVIRITIICTVLISLLTGCQESDKSSGSLTQEEILLTPNKHWQSEFGNSLDVSQTYNIKLLTEAVKQQQIQLNRLSQTPRSVPSTTTTTLTKDVIRIGSKVSEVVPPESQGQ